LTVLALIEAALVYLHQEFPFASIEYIQLDNAAAYHLKELVLAIPLLNAVRSVMMFSLLPRRVLTHKSQMPVSRTENAETERPSDQELCSYGNTGWQEPT
jgi:hypothetical protein